MMLQPCNRHAKQYFIYKVITIRLYVLWLRDIVQMMDAVFDVVMRLFSKCSRGVQITRCRYHLLILGNPSDLIFTL